MTFAMCVCSAWFWSSAAVELTAATGAWVVAEEALSKTDDEALCVLQWDDHRDNRYSGQDRRTFTAERALSLLPLVIGKICLSNLNHVLHFGAPLIFGLRRRIMKRLCEIAASGYCRMRRIDAYFMALIPCPDGAIPVGQSALPNWH